MTRTGYQVDFRGPGIVSSVTNNLYSHNLCFVYIYLLTQKSIFFFWSKKVFDDFDTERAYVTRTRPPLLEATGGQQVKQGKTHGKRGNLKQNAESHSQSRCHGTESTDKEAQGDTEL